MALPQKSQKHCRSVGLLVTLSLFHKNIVGGALPQKSEIDMDTVSTTCDSGWVDDQYATCVLILNPNDLPTRYRRWY
jgi:hypothetical protein